MKRTCALVALLSCVVFSLLLSTIAHARLSDHSGKRAKGVFTQSTSHRGFLEKISYTLDYKNIGAILTHSPASYRYFTPKGNGIRVRQGAGVKYKEHYRISSISAKNKEKGAVLGGIVGKTPLRGDKDCSAWYEILAVRVNDKKGIYTSISDFAHAEYICKDFIKIEKKNPYLTAFLQEYFTFATVKDKYLSKPVKLSKNVALLDGSTGRFIHRSRVVLKKDDSIAFWPRKHGMRELASHLVPVCRLVNKTHALYVGALSKYTIEKTLQLKTKKEQNILRNWIKKYFK